MNEIKGIDLPSKVPAVQYDEIYQSWQSDFDKLDGLSDNKSEFYVKDPDERADVRKAMLTWADGTMTKFGTANLRRNAYGLFLPEEAINGYVGYYALVSKGKPVDWEGTWYEDDWYLQDNPGFYNAMLEKGIWQARDFSKVPTREVFELYQDWQGIPIGRERRDFEAANPELDQWLHLTKGTKLEE